MADLAQIPLGELSFPRRLKELRTIRRLGSRQLGRLLGKSGNYISSLENGGSFTLPSSVALIQLASLLGTTGEWLIVGSGTVPRETAFDRARPFHRSGRPKKVG